MPRLSNPRQRSTFSISLYQVLVAIAILCGLLGVGVGIWLAVQGASIWFSLQLGGSGLIAALLWYVIAHVIRMLREIRDGIRNLNEE